MERVLGQRYELQEFVGGGGMADVYKAKDLLLDRTVAVKILHESFRNDEEFIGKFHFEAKSAAKLSHPNIVGIYDVGIDGNDHYIVMEYVRGDTLKSHIKEGQSLSIKKALDVAREIADGLAHAHANNIVHCDIKPHNILMTDAGHAKVADFGIARAVTESTMTYSGNVVGSVHYFSPEQAKGSFITPKSDVYSLGVVLYEMLTGKLPFTGETPVSIAMKHLQETPPPLRQYNYAIPPVVEAAVMKALAKDPAQRPTAAEFSADLAQAEQMIDSNVEDVFATKIISADEANEIATASRRADERKTPTKTSSVGKKIFIAGLFAVLIAGFCVGLLFFGNFWSQEEVAVPDVVGKQMSLARQILEDEHLRVNVAETYDANIPAGQVVSQSPDPGSKVKLRRLITITVSKGGENLEMPELNGLTRADAEAKIKKMGLKLGAVYEKYSDEEAGTVVGQDPRPSMKIVKGETVDITVSKGKKEEKKQKVTVPNLTGGTLQAAKGSIVNRKLSVGTVTKKGSNQAEGTVISQSPSAGSEIEEGSEIDLVVAEPMPKTDVSPENSNTRENDSAKAAAPKAKTEGDAAPPQLDDGGSKSL